MAARCTTPPAAMHHFTGMDAPFARNQCTTFCGHTVLLGRCMQETAKANSLRLDDYLLHLLSVFPERVAQRKDFEMDDLLPWSGEMKSWFSAV